MSKKQAAIDAILAGANTARGVADATGMSMLAASEICTNLLKMGVLKDTGRRIWDGRGRPTRVFTVSKGR